MTIQVEISAEVEARLAAEAQSRGVSAEQYASLLIDRALLSESHKADTLSLVELRALLNEIGSGSEDRPSLPTSAFTRESIYGEEA